MIKKRKKNKLRDISYFCCREGNIPKTENFKDYRLTIYDCPVELRPPERFAVLSINGNAIHRGIVSHYVASHTNCAIEVSFERFMKELNVYKRT